MHHQWHQKSERPAKWCDPSRYGAKNSVQCQCPQRWLHHPNIFLTQQRLSAFLYAGRLGHAGPGCIWRSAGRELDGQVAVAAVVLNRLEDSQFPNTLSGVVFQKNAFTCVNDGQYYMRPNQTAYKAAMEAMQGADPTNGCLYYWNPETATSKWIWTRSIETRTVIMFLVTKTKLVSFAHNRIVLKTARLYTSCSI